MLSSAKADSVRLYKIRKVISELSGKEGRGTELVSLYIPPKKPIHEVVAYLRLPPLDVCRRIVRVRPERVWIVYKRVKVADGVRFTDAPEIRNEAGSGRHAVVQDT